MDEVNHTPDAPFRSGVTGKYKLLIKSATRKPVNYEYELVDADGKEYKAGHPKHYAEGELLRCMVYFKVANAKLAVTETLICNKQDLTTPIPEVTKVKPQQKVKETTEIQNVMNEPDDPIRSRASGVYKLRVTEIEEKGDKYLYTLEDAKNRKYKVESDRRFSVGSVINCGIQTIVTQNGLRVKVVSIGKKQKTKKKRSGSSGHNQRDWLPSPSKGDHFHLIYTPMGNKR